MNRPTRCSTRKRRSTADERRELGNERLDIVRELQLPEVESEVQLWEGTVSQVLTSAIDRDSADLVVLGTRGGTGG